MQTAVLDQMNAGVCDALLGTQNAQLLLDSLEQDNLFVISLDEKREWYRYHHLFREFLLGKLRREALNKLVQLEQIAGAYYENQGEVEAAFAHYVRAQDFAAAARVLLNGTQAISSGQVTYVRIVLPVEPNRQTGNPLMPMKKNDDEE